MKDYTKSRFQERIRITKKQLNWIKKKKGDKTSARFLEEMINEHIKLKKCTK